jgi:hypothetical protein
MNENGNLIESYRENLNLRTLKKTCAGVTLTTTNPTWSRLELNLAFRAVSQKPANTDLSDATHPPNVSKSVRGYSTNMKERSVIVALYMLPEDT